MVFMILCVLHCLRDLWLIFSNLREHKFRHNFADSNDPFRLCRTNAINTTVHLLYCPNIFLYRNILFDNLHCNGLTLLLYNSCHLTKLFLYGDIKFRVQLNRVLFVFLQLPSDSRVPFSFT